MEVSVVGCSQTSVGRSELLHRKVGLCNSRLIWPKSSRIRFDPNRRWKRGFLAVALKTIRAEVSRSETIWGERSSGRTYATKSGDRIQLYVGLPIDTVSSCNNLNHTRAIAAGLKALKLLGVQGVEFPLWWGVVENEAHGKYNWSAYLALAQMVRDAGLKLRVMLCFHALATPAAPLPQWVSRIGDTNPDIFFADKSGRRYKECLSLSVDDLPVLDGKTPMQVYEDFLQSFKSSFSDFMGSTVTDISVGLGPDGELRYPSFPMSTKSNEILGVGEFQCYDKHMLDSLKQQAQTSGNPLWGLSGPHDTPAYNQSPESNSFFRENGGSWETPYGDFFLSWYSSQLLSHGERLLSLASSTFSDSPVTVSGKIPQMHSWYKTRSHPSELTAGYYNTANRDGYDDVAEMFARNSCRMILPGLDLSNKDQPDAANSSPDSLLSQIMVACSKHGVQISGENFALSSSQASFRNIKGRLFSSLSVDQFTYQRMGAYFFSPDHFPLFTEFVRSLYQAELDMDDRPSDKEETIPFTTTPSDSEKNLQMQAA